MADYLLHLVGRKLTSDFCADDSAGSIPLMQIKFGEKKETHFISWDNQTKGRMLKWVKNKIQQYAVYKRQSLDLSIKTG